MSTQDENTPDISTPDVKTPDVKTLSDKWIEISEKIVQIRELLDDIRTSIIKEFSYLDNISIIKEFSYLDDLLNYFQIRELLDDTYSNIDALLSTIHTKPTKK